MIQDDERLREERKKAKKNREKYVGINSDFHSGGFGGSSSSYRSSSSYNDFASSSSSRGGSDFKTPGYMNELDEKEWKSNQSAIQEKITDITAKVKNILDKSADNDAASNGLSDDERDEDFSSQRNNTNSSRMKSSNTVSSISTSSSARIDPTKLKKSSADKKPASGDRLPKPNVAVNTKALNQDNGVKVWDLLFDFNYEIAFFNLYSFVNIFFNHIRNKKKIY